MSGFEWHPRLACESDVPAIQSLMEQSARELQAGVYSREQIDAALGPVYAVDRQLIQDKTYFVVEDNGSLVGCGGWSNRKSWFGGDVGRPKVDEFLDPTLEPARVRAFFVHPAWARKGIGSAILRACERAIQEAQFSSIEMVATLSGQPLYESFGYEVAECFEITLPQGLSLPVVRMSKKIGF